jgi:hypothetical protein
MCFIGSYRLLGKDVISHSECCVGKILTLVYQMNVKYLYERRFGWTINLQNNCLPVSQQGMIQYCQ